MTDTKRSDLTESLARGVNQRGVTLAYGDKQTIDGLDFIPVAFVTYGFGGIQDSAQFGAGGGGGGVAIPIGAYVGWRGGIRFRPNTIAALVVGVLAIKTLGLAIKFVVKGTR